ncbi:MAG: hypothetical protein O7D29_04880 [Gemmatimonadetes bacterium]|nr:hypothetical protein [Gemmatimonadota bacterium]
MFMTALVHLLAHITMEWAAGGIAAGIGVGWLIVRHVFLASDLEKETSARWRNERAKSQLEQELNELRSPDGIQKRLQGLIDQAVKNREAARAKKQEIDEKIAGIKAAERDHENASTQLNIIRRGWKEKLKQVGTLKDQLAKATKALEREKKRADTLTNQIADARRDTAMFEQKSREAEVEAPRCREERAAAEKRCGELTTIAEKLRAELGQAKEKCAVAERQYESVKRELDLIKQREKQAIAERRRLSKRKTDLENSIQRTETDLERLGKEISSIEETQSLLKEESIQLEKRRDELAGVEEDLIRIRKESKKLDKMEQNYPKVMKLAGQLAQAVKEAKEAA